jgi:hypothetical protein
MSKRKVRSVMSLTVVGLLILGTADEAWSAEEGQGEGQDTPAAAEADPAAAPADPNDPADPAAAPADPNDPADPAEAPADPNDPADPAEATVGTTEAAKAAESEDATEPAADTSESEESALLPPAAAAAEPEPPAQVGTEQEPVEPRQGDAPRFPLTVGVEFGASFSQVLSKLRTSFTPALEVGYLLPFLAQRVQAYAHLSYVFPSYNRSVDDPRLGDGSYKYRIKEEELLLTLGGLYRWLPPGAPLNFYGQVGYRIRMQRSEVGGGAGGNGFGRNRETKTEPLGLVMAGGVEYALIWGAIAAEIDFSVGDLDHRVTGDVTAGGLVVQVGYHFLF